MFAWLHPLRFSAPLGVVGLVIALAVLPQGARGQARATEVPRPTATPAAPRDTAALPDTATRLATATVSATRLRQRPVGSTGLTLDPTALRGRATVAEALDRAGVHVRDYGPGSLASVSVRGGSAAHTLALWNGLPLVNPSLGQLDWSLLALAGEGQSVAVTRGGNSLGWGSGAVAATVSLDDAAPAPGDTAAVRALAGATGGAFGERGARLRLDYGRGRWRAVSRADGLRADNDFRFALPAGERRRQTHAALARANLRQDLYLDLGPGARLAVHYWFNRTDRQIPPTLTQRRSAATELDLAHRLSARYTRLRRAYGLVATAGYFAERLDYRDSLAGVDSPSDFTRLLGDATVTVPLPRGQRLLAGATASHTRARVDEAYGDEPRELALAGFVSHAWAWRRLTAQAGLRLGRVGAVAEGLSPSLGVEYALAPGWRLRGRVARDFRAPTFNDRFYRPGGNPDLRPEAGWAGEVGFDGSRGPWTLALTGYRRAVRDWLLWARVPDRGYFSATNLAAVVSTGLEPRVGFRQNLSRGLACELHLGYDLVYATNRVAVATPRIERGQALWYVPRHSGLAQAQVSWRALRAQYTQRWRGATRGLNEDVAASSTGDLALYLDGATPLRPRARAARPLGWGAFVELRNVGDVRYQLVERRPLPGRWLRGGVRVTW